MKIAPNHRLLVITLLFCSALSGPKNFSIAQTIPDPPAQHPRILLLAGEEKQIQQAIQSDPTWMKMHQAILDESDKIINLPPVEHVKIGRRLLDKSREALRRIFQLAYAYRLTKEDKYAKRAEKEMLAIAAFSDWNPTHYLDVGEMTMALAIGYDWIYPTLSPESRKTISHAIIEKGLNTSLEERYNNFVRVSNNWNQVCNAGITFGALAVYEEVPDLAKQLFKRAINSIKLPMEDYAPNGAYPEGYGYWNYGTTFNVLFLSALEKAFGTDYNLSKRPGFMETPTYLEFMTGPTGMAFNYSDSGQGGSLSPAMFWFAQKSNDPSLLWIEKEYLQRDDLSGYTRNRILPALMIWGISNPLDKVIAPTQNVWVGQGKSPVALMRSSWTDPNAIYVGFKAGSPSVNHAHMDVGSFVMEADGMRWALDLGAQEYNSLESRGMDIWGKTQDAQRWTVKRYNNFIHNTLTVNDQYQQVKGYAKIDDSGESKELKYAVSDLSELYAGRLAAAKRGIGIVNDTYVVVRDEVKAADKPAKVRWVMLTSPDGVQITGSQTATINKDGKRLTLRVDSPAHVKFQTWSTAPTTDYDAPNEGTVLVGFEYEVPAGASQTLQVSLIPGSTNSSSAPMNKSLAQWGKK